MRGVAALLLRRRPVRPEDLERHGTSERGRRLVDDRGVGRSRAATIWMDGRPHPPRTRSTRAEVSRPAGGKATRSSRTTHMKAGFLRKNGPPSSDQATMTWRFFRHGDLLTVLVVIDDPIYLAEPEIISKSFQISPRRRSRRSVRRACPDSKGRPPGESVPHYLPEEESIRRRVDEAVSHSSRGCPRRGSHSLPRVPGKR